MINILSFLQHFANLQASCSFRQLSWAHFVFLKSYQNTTGLFHRGNYSEQELADAVRAGDPDAFRALFGRIGRPLLYFGMRIIGNQAEAEDAVSEAFEKLWGRKEDMRSYASLRSFLYTVVYHKCLNDLKHRKVVAASHPYLVPGSSTDSEADFEGRMVQAETLMAVYRAIELLSPYHRELLTKSFLENRTTREIALEQGKSEAYIRTTRARAISALRMILKEKGLLALFLFFLSAVA